MKNITKVFKILVSAALCVCFGVIAGMLIHAKVNKPNNDPFEMANIQTMPNAKGIIDKIKVLDVLVESVTGKSELVTMQSELVQQMQMDQSFTEWDIFKKTQDIVFYGTCKYSTDLSSFSTEDVTFTQDGKIIEIAVPAPVISSLEINENETYIKSTDNGLLRFGEIKLTAFDDNEIRKTVKDRMLAEAENEKNMELARVETRKAVGELFNEFLNASGFSGYEIKVEFK